MAVNTKEHLDTGGRIAWLANLDTDYTPTKNYRRSSIICTIGPKTNSVEAINKLRTGGTRMSRERSSCGQH